VNIKLILLSISLLLASKYTKAQVYLYSGAHKNFVRTKKIQNASPAQSYHLGAAVNVFQKDNNKVFYTYDVGVIDKGYSQQLGGENFNFQFRYATVQATVSYLPVRWVALKAGFNGALLIYSNVYKWSKVYVPIDLGLVAGLSLLENKRIGLYFQAVYGLLPMIDYYDIDAKGNFNGRLYELRNVSVMAGLRVDIYGKKFFF
jgi:hypothetical protein